MPLFAWLQGKVVRIAGASKLGSKYLARYKQFLDNALHNGRYRYIELVAEANFLVTCLGYLDEAAETKEFFYNWLDSDAVQVLHYAFPPYMYTGSARSFLAKAAQKCEAGLQLLYQHA